MNNIKKYNLDYNRLFSCSSKGEDEIKIISKCLVEYGHIIQIKRKKLLIVFVPGIMASRLMNDDHMIWDPDSIPTMIKFLGMEPIDRQALLLHDYPLTVPGIDDGYGKIPKHYIHALERGWNTIAWTCYGALIKNLDKWTTQIKSFVDMKVYAFGYNWLQSNEISGNELKVMLTDLVDQEKRSSEDVKVLIISHSMGGLVMRECINEMDNTGLISGLIWKIGKHLIISGCDAGLIPTQSVQEISEIRSSIAEMEEYNYMYYRHDNIDRFPYIYSAIFQNDAFPYLKADCPICLDEQKILCDLCAICKYKIYESQDNIFFSLDEIKKIKYVIKNMCFDLINNSTV